MPLTQRRPLSSWPSPSRPGVPPAVAGDIEWALARLKAASQTPEAARSAPPVAPRAASASAKARPPSGYGAANALTIAAVPIAGILDGAGTTVLLAVAVALGLSIVSAVAPRSRINPPTLSLALSAIGSVGILALGLIVLATGAPISARVGDVLGFSLVSVQFDDLAAVFLLALGAVGIASSIFGMAPKRGTTDTDRTAGGLPVFLGGLVLVFGCRSGVRLPVRLGAHRS